VPDGTVNQGKQRSLPDKLTQSPTWDHAGGQATETTSQAAGRAFKVRAEGSAPIHARGAGVAIATTLRSSIVGAAHGGRTVSSTRAGSPGAELGSRKKAVVAPPWVTAPTGASVAGSAATNACNRSPA